MWLPPIGRKNGEAVYQFFIDKYFVLSLAIGFPMCACVSLKKMFKLADLILNTWWLVFVNYL